MAGPDGERGQWAMDGFFTAVSIHSRIPEARRHKALELLDTLCSPEGLELLRYGVEGVHWATRERRRVPLLPREGGAATRFRKLDPSASLRDFVELGDIWLPEWDPNHERISEAVGSGERYGQVPLFLHDKTEAEKRYRKTLTDTGSQEYVRLVQSEDFDAQWEGTVQQWSAAGGKATTRERNSR